MCEAKDTEALVGDLQMPEVDPEIVSGHVGLLVTVDRDGVDVVGVCVGENPAWRRLHHEFHGLELGHAQGGDHARVPSDAIFILQVVTLRTLVTLRHLPQLDCLVYTINAIYMNLG